MQQTRIPIVETDRVQRSVDILPDLVKHELEKIMASQNFDASERNRNFLRFVVDETLEGRADRIKGYNVALAVFDRDSTFDPQIDPVVRIEAGRLRRSLERFYLTDGRGSRLQIRLPKGSYVPNFDVSDVAERALPPAHGLRPELLVAPFGDLTGDADRMKFGAGLTEDIVAELGAQPELRLIVSRTTDGDPSMSFASDRLRYQLSGSVRSSRHELRVVAHLVDLTDFHHLWSRVFEKRLGRDAPHRLQRDLSRRIVASIPLDGLFS